MTLEQDINDVRVGIREGRYTNEASVSQGIVLRMLEALGWPRWKPEIVYPEYPMSGGRVDYALHGPLGELFVLIEVKKIGLNTRAYEELFRHTEQLFNYTYQKGGRLAILTNGRFWSFFLTEGGLGGHADRMFCNLDLLNQDAHECAERLSRYLGCGDTYSGVAWDAAKREHSKLRRARVIQSSLDRAWRRLVAENEGKPPTMEDEGLAELMADRAESLCGFRPEPGQVAEFLRKLPGAVPSRGDEASLRLPRPNPSVLPAGAGKPKAESRSAGRIGFWLGDNFHPVDNKRELLPAIFRILDAKYADFLEKFESSSYNNMTTRRQLARERLDLNPARPDQAMSRSKLVRPGWWLMPHSQKSGIERVVQRACEVVKKLDPETNLRIELGE